MILKSLDELQIYMSNLNVEKYRAKFYDLKATFLETENISNKKHQYSDFARIRLFHCLLKRHQP